MLAVVITTAIALAQAPIMGLARAEPRIVVEGFGSVKTPPDIADISFDVRGEGLSSDQAVSALVAKAAAVERSLRSIDPSVELTSESVRVQAVPGTGCKDEDEYRSAPRLSTGKCATAGYVATQDFDAATSRVTDAGTMVGLAGRAGAYGPRIASFRLRDPSVAKQQAIAAAFDDARSKAQAIARASNAALGAVVNVTLDGARGAEMVVVGRRVPAPALERDEAPINVNITPEPVNTTSQLTVSYELAR